jgi:GTP1/Obg family GTP-binding protein
MPKTAEERERIGQRFLDAVRRMASRDAATRSIARCQVERLADAVLEVLADDLEKVEVETKTTDGMDEFERELVRLKENTRKRVAYGACCDLPRESDGRGRRLGMGHFDDGGEWES